MYLMLLDGVQMDWKKGSVGLMEKYEELQLILSDISENVSSRMPAYVLLIYQWTL